VGNIGTVVLLLTGAPLALAQSSPQPAQDGMLKNGPPVWDANHDSVYTCDEWKSFADRIFTSADRNRDGHLDPSPGWQNHTQGVRREAERVHPAVRPERRLSRHPG
jgi:hypothetical protein